MRLEEQYEQIATTNTTLLSRVVVYINDYNNRSFIAAGITKVHIRNLLKEIRNSNNQVHQLRKQRARIREDLEDLERAFYSSSTYEGTGEGKNTGGRPNNVELRQIRKSELKEQLGDLLIKTQLIEKSFVDNNKLIRQFIHLLPQKQYIAVLELTYIECMSNVAIASELNYSREFVDKARERGIKSLAEILKKYIGRK